MQRTKPMKLSNFFLSTKSVKPSIKFVTEPYDATRLSLDHNSPNRKSDMRKSNEMPTFLKNASDYFEQLKPVRRVDTSPACYRQLKVQVKEFPPETKNRSMRSSVHTSQESVRSSKRQAGSTLARVSIDQDVQI
jgi:hypothetical protein